MSPPVISPVVRFSEVIAGLSYALDLTEGQRRGHAARTCLIGMRIAQTLGLGEADRASLFYALLMKDLGCSSNAARFAALFGAADQDLKAAIKTINWTRAIESFRFITRSVAPGAFFTKRIWRTLAVLAAGTKGANEVVRTRCERGADIARLLEFSNDTVQAIRTIDEHWNGAGQPYRIRGEGIPLLGRIVCLAQTAEVFATTYGEKVAFDMAATRRGRWFDPQVVDAFMTLKSDDAFWRDQAFGNPLAAVAAFAPVERVLAADDAKLDRAAEAFARVIDAKSPWTYRHSTGVAEVAVRLAAEMGRDGQFVRELRRAALLHDLGKLGVSNLILDKPGRLGDDELTAMRRHPGYTSDILERAGCFAHLAPMASAHHERLDGRGYHRGLSAPDLSLASRILCVADVCDALRASRPYREGLPDERVLEIMQREAGSALDVECVGALRNVLAAMPAAGATVVPAVQLVPALSEDYTQAA